jgi:hypothetical protein
MPKPSQNLKKHIVVITDLGVLPKDKPLPRALITMSISVIP